MPNLQFNISRLDPLFAYIKKQQEVEKSRRIFEISLTFALVSFFLFFAVKPTALTISSLIGDIKSKQLLTTKMKAKLDQVITAQDNFALIQEKYFLVEEALPTTQNYVSAYDQINYLSTKNNFILNNLSFDQSSKNYFTAKISTTSSFIDSLSFINSIFANRRLFNIPEITFAQDKDASLRNQILVNIPLDIYFGQNLDEKK